MKDGTTEFLGYYLRNPETGKFLVGTRQEVEPCRIFPTLAARFPTREKAVGYRDEVLGVRAEVVKVTATYSIEPAHEEAPCPSP